MYVIINTMPTKNLLLYFCYSRGIPVDANSWLSLNYSIFLICLLFTKIKASFNLILLFSLKINTTLS